MDLHERVDMTCGDYLMEDDWEEGFHCTLPKNHKPPHRMETNVQENLTGTHSDGRSYTWAYEWTYTKG